MITLESLNLPADVLVAQSARIQELMQVANSGQSRKATYARKSLVAASRAASSVAVFGPEMWVEISNAYITMMYACDQDDADRDTILAQWDAQVARLETQAVGLDKLWGGIHQIEVQLHNSRH